LLGALPSLLSYFTKGEEKEGCWLLGCPFAQGANNPTAKKLFFFYWPYKVQ